PWRKDLLATARHLLALRREHPALRPDAFFTGRPRPAAPDGPAGAVSGAGSAAGAGAPAGQGSGGELGRGAGAGAGTGARAAAGSGPGPRPTAGLDLAWFDAGGGPLDHGAWHDPGVRTLQMLRTAPEPGDADVLVVLTGALDPVDVTLPGL